MKSRSKIPILIRKVARVMQACAIALFVSRYDDHTEILNETARVGGRLRPQLIQTLVSAVGRLADSDPFYELAWGFASRFTRSHPEYSLYRSTRLSQGNTNRIVLAKRGDTAVVIKVYADKARKACELFALEHLAMTGWSPQVVDRGTGNLLVMSQIPGSPLDVLLRAHIANAGLIEMAKQLYARSSDVKFKDDQRATGDAPDFVGLGRQIGQALATITRIPAPALEAVKSVDLKPGSFSFQRANLSDLLRRYLDAAWRSYEMHPSYHSDLFRESLLLQEDQLETILRQPQFMFLYDLNPGNILIRGPRLSGFVDLEACRCGTEAMQLGSALFSFANFPHIWHAILEGYEREIGHRIGRTRLQATLAMSHFYFWGFITYWGDTAQIRPKRFALPNATDAARHFQACEAVIGTALRNDAEGVSCFET